MTKNLKALTSLALINIFLAIGVSLRYFEYMPELPNEWLSQIFLVSSIYSHMLLLVVVVSSLFIPLIFLPARLFKFVASLFAALGVILLFIDTVVFAQYKFHINGAVLELILAGQIVTFPWITWAIVVSAVLLLWLFQWGMLSWFSQRPLSSNLKKKIGLSFILTFIASSVIHIWAAAHAYQPVTSVKRYLPLYYPISANSFMRKQGWINEEEVARQKQLSQKRAGNVQYPLKPIEVSAVEKPVNILFLVIDSWRYDTMNADNTPAIWRAAQEGVIFNNHWSTGNSTRTGIFGLFYGLPGTYWQGILSSQTSPILLDRMQQLDYRMGVFASAQLHKPEFNRTVFARIQDLREESLGDTPAERDKNALSDWQEWLEEQETDKPFFSFLFFDAPHGYDYPAGFEAKFTPELKDINYLSLNNATDPTPMLNRYKNSVLYNDSLTAQVFETLKEKGLWENTLLIITSDHGQEINDTQHNFWGHNSNFTSYQVQVPLILVGPRVQDLTNNNHMTSHVDIAPTLLNQYLGVQNDAAEYSTGNSLFSTKKRDWALSASYSNFAIISKNRIFEVDATGSSQLLDGRNNPVPVEKVNAQFLQEALEQMSRFNR